MSTNETNTTYQDTKLKRTVKRRDTNKCQQTTLKRNVTSRDRTTQVRAQTQNMLFESRGCVLPSFPFTRFCPACEILTWQVGGLEMPSQRNSTFRFFICGKSVVLRCPACKIIHFEMFYSANAFNKNGGRNLTFRN